MIRRIPVFWGCFLTKFGPESGETAEEILARKDLERRSGVGAHKNEFWWSIGKKGTAQSIETLISQHGGNVVLFAAIKDQKLLNRSSASAALVWRKYRVLGSDTLHDLPKHVLITSAAVSKSGAMRTKHFALVCNSSVPLKMGGRVFRYSNRHYKNLRKDGKLWKVCKRAKNYHGISQVANTLSA
jgi:hypothetical protein